MEQLIKFAEIAWNPMNAIRYHLLKGTLKPMSILIAYLAVVVGCNIAVMSAQKFLFESIEFATENSGLITSHPFIKNTFAQQFLSSIGVIIPSLVIYLIPKWRFEPYGRPAAMSCLFILAASWAFYGAVLGIPSYIFSGLAISSNPELGIQLFSILGILSSIAVLVIVIVFWLKSFKILELTTSTIILTALLVIGAEFLMAYVLILLME